MDPIVSGSYFPDNINLRQGLGYLTCRISSTAKYHQRQQQGRAAAYPLHVSVNNLSVSSKVDLLSQCVILFYLRSPDTIQFELSPGRSVT